MNILFFNRAITGMVLLSLSLAPVAAAEEVVVETDRLRLEVATEPLRWRLTAIESGEVVLELAEATVRIDGRGRPVTDARVIERGPDGERACVTLAGTVEGLDRPVRIDLALHDGLAVTLAADSDVEGFGQGFVDRGERVYGIWEQPYGDGALDNRGVAHDFTGHGRDRDVDYASARAPFYVTDRGYGVWVDSLAHGRYEIAVDDRTRFRFHEPRTLSYHVIYGPGYREIFARYNRLDASPILPPIWAFGTIWWRNDHNRGHQGAGVDSARELILADADAMRANRIYGSGIWIDRPYGTGGHGWGNLDFTDSFGDPAELVDDVQQRGMELMAWVANRWSNTVGTQANQRGWLFDKSWPAMDLRNQEAFDWLLRRMLVLPQWGFKGYKIDRGHEGEMPAHLENLIVPRFLELCAMTMQHVHGDDWFNFARNVNGPARAHAAVWNGDTEGSWGGLRVSLKNALRCGAINMPMWGSDIGGYKGEPDEELFLRWMQFGVYSTFTEVLIGPGRTPWLDGSAELVEQFAALTALNHDLAPYARSIVAASAETGWPAMCAMTFAHPDDPRFADTWDQYYFGPSLLAAPILNPHSQRRVLLPQGLWLDYNDRRSVHQGGGAVEIRPGDDVIAVYVRAGAIVPRGDIFQANRNWDLPETGWAPTLRIECFPAEGEQTAFPLRIEDRTVEVRMSTRDGRTTIVCGPTGVEQTTLEIYAAQIERVAIDGADAPLAEYDQPGRVLLVPIGAGGATVEVEGRGLFDR